MNTPPSLSEVFCDRILGQNSTLLWGIFLPSVFMCVLGAEYDHLIKMVLLSTNSIFLLGNNNYGLNIIKVSGLVVLSVCAGMTVCIQLSVLSSTCHRSL